jgi:hypothetical protein
VAGRAAIGGGEKPVPPLTLRDQKLHRVRMVTGGKKRFACNTTLNAGNIVEELRDLCQKHPASHHLFDFLSSSASSTQIDYFFKSDSALNLLFFDLVAMGLVGSCRKLAQKSPKISGMK